MKGSKACLPTRKLKDTHVRLLLQLELEYCAAVFGENNKTSLPFSCKPQRPDSALPLPLPLDSSVLVNRFPTGHLLRGQGTTATPSLLNTPP